VRLADRGVVGALSDGWRRRVPWYPGDWIWPVLLGLLVASAAAAVVIYVEHRREHNAPIVETSAHVTNQPPVSTVSTTIPAPPEQPTTQTRPKPPAARGSTLFTWPSGRRSGYTVVLDSVPTSSGRAHAIAQAKRAIAAGLTNVGILDSSAYPSLHAGYFVVFSGVYGGNSDAQSAATSAHANGYPDAYVGYVAR
jgi:hypothetical protein